MLKQFEIFLAAYDTQIAKSPGGGVARDTREFEPVATMRILSDLQRVDGLDGLPTPEPQDTLHIRLAKWVAEAAPEQKEVADLALPVPPSNVHFVPGQFPIFYDFKNTDIVLDDLQKTGVAIRGHLLDFGCSSGRNLAVLKRAYRDQLQLTGADPAAPSIDWLNANISGVEAIINDQTPPLPFAVGSFDLVIAKSIWTHFSRRPLVPGSSRCSASCRRAGISCFQAWAARHRFAHCPRPSATAL